MATLVLNTVGTLLGGPVGGAIGSLVGQSIDQQLFGPGPRHGPRLGDLSVQTSSYGSAIPKLFGRMRVAGTIIWSTDLQEQSQTQSAKGQADTVTYSYSVSFAVALSSRQIADVGRIWADGKLIRDANGEFTVATTFRVLKGSEDQPLDPLIASVEGLNSTPAYRGIAIAIFENLQLADFGNRIPFLTFEVIADAAPPTIGDVLKDVSSGAIDGGPAEAVPGYAAYGASVRAAVAPLVQAWDIALFDNGSVLSPPLAETIAIASDETGCSADERPAPRIEKSQIAAPSLPASLSISYYDSERDYQTGLARASLDTASEVVEQIDLPAVVEAGSAKALAEQSLARHWAERDKVTLRLPPSYLGLAPGALVAFPGEPDSWRAQQITVDSLAILAELRPVYHSVTPLLADSGRVAPSTADIPQPTELAIIELPDDGTGAADSPVIAIAATSAEGHWRSVPLQVEISGSQLSSRTAGAPTIMGKALTPLGIGQSCLFDLENSVDIELTRTAEWLESRDDDALAAGENLALLGDELIQFGDVLALGSGRFRLSRLLRGRRGTEWAMERHSSEEIFVLLDQRRLQRIQVSAGQVGALIRVTPEGLADANAIAVEAAVSGEALRPPSPVRLRAWFDSAGSLQCSWVRRSSRGWTWLDNVDSPLGCSTELYQVTLTAAGGAADLQTTEPQATFDATQMASMGSGDAELAVVQVGDLAVSRAAIASITIN